ncbi:glycosyltransferase [Lachnospiraceae bacterium 38-10]
MERAVDNGTIFSVVTVCLNPGEKLNITLDSILKQSFEDLEVILKDGGSEDGAAERWRRENASRPGAEKVKIFVEKDAGIYDAMNQAAARASGKFLLFLNCGDTFADESVLERAYCAIKQEEDAGADTDRLVMYGDTCGEKNGVVIASAPEITGFTCYRNIPCHQSCFYSAALCREKPYDLRYKIRADYDHFLWCYYRAGAMMRHMGFAVAAYEGGGISEARANRATDKREHGQIVRTYISGRELFRYRLIMVCTLAPLRTAMAESRAFSGVYHWLKEKIYAKK